MGDEAPAEDRSEADGHRGGDPRRVGCRIITVSDTRTVDTDASGQEIARLLSEAGHRVLDRVVVPDASDQLRDAVLSAAEKIGCDAVLITGGTGIAPRDQTPEVVAPLLDVSLPGFGELLRTISFEEIGPAAMLSRALAGRRGRTVVFVMPGSRGAVRTAMQRLILPVLPHAVGQAGKED